MSQESSSAARRWVRSAYVRDALTLAQALLGQRLVRVLEGRRLAGIIVETEAYLGVEDLAAHTAKGRRTPRNASMWLEGGHAYVYFTYGMHYCMNVVAGRAEEPVAVLLRALEPTQGIETMRQHRPGAKKDTLLCSGPARLCQALAIDRAMDGTDMTASDNLFIERIRQTPYPRESVVHAARVGVGYAGEWADKPLRFYLRGNVHVSRP